VITILQHNKKGQLSFYLLIGTLVLMIVLLFSVLEQRRIEQEVVDFTPVENFIQGCLEESAKEGLIAYGNLGGTITHDKYYITSFGETPAFEPNETKTTDELLIVLQKETKQNLDHCLDDMSKLQDYTIEKTNAELSVEQIGKDMHYKLIYPIQIKKGESVKAFSTFTYDLEFDAQNFINALNELLQAITRTKIPLSNMLDIKEKSGITVNSYIDDGLTVYVLEDDISKIDQTWQFVFCVEDVPEEVVQNE